MIDNNLVLEYAGLTYAKAGDVSLKKIRECASEVIRKDGDVEITNEKQAQHVVTKTFPTKEAENAFKQGLMMVSTMMRGTQSLVKEKKSKRKVEENAKSKEN